MQKITNKGKKGFCIFIFLIVLFVLGSCGLDAEDTKEANNISTEKQNAHDLVKNEEKILGQESKEELSSNSNSKQIEDNDSGLLPIELNNIPDYSGEPFVVINNNNPFFTESDLTTDSYEYYSDLDSLGRCRSAYACIGKDLMPTEKRGSIGQVKPTGWHTIKYDCVDGKYLYNRCHLIGYQLTAENSNTKNLITGTRYLNVEGMLPFENMVGDYIEETNNHVLYRVTPIFDENNQLASGVLMEAKSVEDNGGGILFNVYCYNVQPGVTINYVDGSSSSSSEAIESDSFSSSQNTPELISSLPLSEDNNLKDMVRISETGSKYHSINNCGRMNPENASQITEEEAHNRGLQKCQKCW